MKNRIWFLKTTVFCVRCMQRERTLPLAASPQPRDLNKHVTHLPLEWANRWASARPATGQVLNEARITVDNIREDTKRELGYFPRDWRQQYKVDTMYERDFALVVEDLLEFVTMEPAAKGFVSAVWSIDYSEDLWKQLGQPIQELRVIEHQQQNRAECIKRSMLEPSSLWGQLARRGRSQADQH